MSLKILNAKIAKMSEMIAEKENELKELCNDIKDLKDGKKKLEMYIKKYSNAIAEEQKLLEEFAFIDVDEKPKRSSRRKTKVQKTETSVQTNVNKEQLDKQKDVEDVQPVVHNQEKVNDDLKYFNY